ncbi:MAG TPA: hypothetical protein PK772_02845 [Chitinophagaceae bacterium]|nr:hypothetical protein [Chitinophagaceae bacterium]
MTTKQLKKYEVLGVKISNRLNQYADKVLFPEKLAKANQTLKTTKLPKALRKNTKKNTSK